MDVTGLYLCMYIRHKNFEQISNLLIVKLCFTLPHLQVDNAPLIHIL